MSITLLFRLLAESPVLDKRLHTLKVELWMQSGGSELGLGIIPEQDVHCRAKQDEAGVEVEDIIGNEPM